MNLCGGVREGSCSDSKKELVQLMQKQGDLQERERRIQDAQKHL